MVAVDTNLLVYSNRKDCPWHEKAATVLNELANSGYRWAIPWPCVHEFFNIVTHPKIYSPPTSTDDSLKVIDHWIGCSTLHLIGEGPGYFEKLKKIASVGKIVGPKIHEAKIAAICINHGVSEIWTADRDFSAFPDLKSSNPLIV